MSTPTLSIHRSPRSWLHGFLSQRGLTAPKAQPLYEYQVTSAEYADLKDILSDSARFCDPGRFSAEWCAAFTLYCAEWFRREYNLEWSWQPIFQALGFELSPEQRADVVRVGLERYWGRSISRYQSDRFDYLGSVFKEGGLPSKQLSGDSNNYQQAFSAIFGRYQQAKELGLEAVNLLIRGRIIRLPENLQGEESVELISNMVEQLDGLVHQFSLEKQVRPAAYLDEHFPEWRRSFPLPLESEVGSAFLSQLLEGASEAVKRVACKRTRLFCRHFVSFDNQSISTEVVLPLNCRFELSRLQLTSGRIELAVFEGDKQIASLGPAFVHFEAEHAIARMRIASTLVKRQQEQSELYLVAMQGGQQLADIRLADSALDLGEVPLTLMDDAGKWRVLAQASVTTSREEVFVLTPAHAQMTLVHGLWEHGFNSMRFGEFSLTRLKGRCEIITTDSERFVITTGAEDYGFGTVMIKGEQLNWKTTPALIFLGVPSVSSAEQASEIATNQYSSYLGSHNISSLHGSQLYGRHTFSVRTSENVTLLKKRIGILPRDFSIELIAGVTPDKGVIKISTAFSCITRVLSDLVNVDSLKKHCGVTEILLSAKDMPPESVRLEVTASLGSEPIYIDVPFPSKGALTYDANGQALANQLSVDDLFGARLHLFAQQGCPTSFQVEAISQSTGCTVRPPYYRWQYKVMDKPVQISLYGLRDAILSLLSTSDALDVKVDLSISGPGRTIRHRISRYSMILEYDKGNNTVYPEPLGILPSSSLKPALMNLANPEQKPILLSSRQSQGVNTEVYELPSYVKDGGPWLVIPQESSNIKFRAKFIPGSAEGVNRDELKTLQKAARVYHPHFAPDAISKVLSQMAEDWTHSGWQYLKDTYRNFAYLPLSTFEVWRHLVKDPRALAVALFRFESDPQFIGQIDDELPVLWAFIELKQWRHAVDLMATSLSEAGVPATLVQDVVSRQVDKLAVSIPVFEDTVATNLKHKSMSSPLPVPVMKHMMNDWYQALLNQQSEDVKWPDELGEEIRSCCLALRQMPFEVSTTRTFHNGVVYAPIFAAAIASGIVKGADTLLESDEALFHFRKLRDFDRDWFEPVYRCFINYFTQA
ncbi:STY4851/ECs_5259 family protein [Shewanella xiamenensis]|uniref:STY4851/ECs_5259 family protein n=1 Tax=Shewanella xiamenensis TaxID=332186 RepID=UPI001559CBE7|nr:STY4851/ECs_5259 family protein [Shewanella xiamenensis]